MKLSRTDSVHGRSKCFLYLQESSLIFVALSWPEEPLETIFLMARYEMNMHVRHTLADAVVDSNKRSIGLLNFFNCPLQPLWTLVTWCHKWSGRFGSCRLKD